VKKRFGKGRLSTALAVAGVAFTGAIGIGAAEGQSTVEPPSAETQPRAMAVDPVQAQAFEVLRRPQRDSDALPGKVKGPFGANLDLARRVSGPAGDVRVVPASDGQLCLRAEDGSGSAWTCVSTARAKAGLLMLTLRGEGVADVNLYGLVPDGIRSVSLQDASGSRQLSVLDNVYTAISSDPKTLSFDGGSGAQTVSVP
jgi:hypothetical protein